MKTGISALAGIALLLSLSFMPAGDRKSPPGGPGAFGQPYDLKASIERGKEVYAGNCQSCHMENGEGLPDVFPPVAKTDYIKKDANHLINIVLKGQEGEIIVNGKKYNTPMAAQDYLSDEQIADVYNYIRNSWGSKLPAILPSQVKALRGK
jgi:mono/diheme cytochrome c family protein